MNGRYDIARAADARREYLARSEPYVQMLAKLHSMVPFELSMKDGKIIAVKQLWTDEAARLRDSIQEHIDLLMLEVMRGLEMPSYLLETSSFVASA